MENEKVEYMRTSTSCQVIKEPFYGQSNNCCCCSNGRFVRYSYKELLSIYGSDRNIPKSAFKRVDFNF